jgi:hypothetical protein
MTLTAPFDTFYAGVLAREDAEEASEIIRQYGGTAKATKKPNGILLVGFFIDGLSHETRCGIVSAFGNAGICKL